MNILWVGPLVSDEALVTKKSTDAAEAKWSRGLLRGLAEIGCSIDVVTHCPEQCWPRGRVFWQRADARWFLNEFPMMRIGYPNWPVVRERYLCHAYARAVRQIMASKHIDAILCYNSMHVYHMAALRQGRKLGAKAVPIILDAGLGKSSPLDDNWVTMLRDNRGADGLVFLSYWCCQNYPDKAVPVFHMDGGSDGFKGTPPISKSANDFVEVVYTGSIDKTRGARFLAEVCSILKNDKFHFTICGKGSDKFEALLSADERKNVAVRGFVSDAELRDISAAADVFVSMREPDYGLNLFNYPSKIPQYLAWGRPVVSTWLESFSPDYRDVLFVACENTPQAFAGRLRDVSKMSDDERTSCYNVIREWFVANKDWRVQAARLVEYIEKIPAA